MNLIRSLTALPLHRIARHPDIVLAFLVASVVAVMIVPLPPAILDMLLATNVTLSAVILAAVLLSDRALSVSTFPSLLLLTTLLRLTLNVSTTRLVLSKGTAGEVVRAFGEFVVGGDIVVGLVVFVIITLVQFLVIAKGAERVAEVGARFTLDAMPGNQMSIDAALRAGSITDEQAREKRDELGRESQFYGAMDGAMKFVKGDAIAGLIITAINLVAGMVIGVLRFKMSAGSAAQTYSVLTVGDGLVSQIPALLITLAAAVVTTRVASREKRSSLGASLKAELLTSHKVLAVGGSFAMLLALMPGLPMLPFGFLGGCLILGAYLRYRSEHRVVTVGGRTTTTRQEAIKQQIDDRVKTAQAQKSLSDNIAPAVIPIGIDIDPTLSLALGFGGGPDSETELVAELLPQLRDALYMETGVKFPGIRVRSGVPQLAQNTIAIRIKEIPVAVEHIESERWMAGESPDRVRRLDIDAIAGRHPFSGKEVSLVPAEAAKALEAAGIRVWSPASIIALHIARVLRKHAKMFIGLQETGDLVERLEKVYPTLVKEVVPRLIALPQLSDILKRLVDEGVSIRDLKSVFEVLAEQGPHQTDNVILTEQVRAGLSLQIAHTYAGSANRLPVVLLDDVIEDTIRGSIAMTAGGSYLALDLEVRRALIQAIAKTIRPVVSEGVRPVILTTSDIRRYVRKLLEEDMPETTVLSFQELPAQLTIQPLGRAAIRTSLAA